MAFPVLEVLTVVFKPLVDLIDDLHTSDEEKLAAKQKLFEAQVGFYVKVMDFEARQLEVQGKIVEAEAKSENFITASWRPIVMLTFAGLVVARWFGYSAPDIPLEIEAQLWTLLQIGLGGYVAGRSLEKIATTVGQVITQKTAA